MGHIGVRVVPPLLTIWSVGAVSCAEVAADEARLKAYGQHLSQQCTACHRADGVRVGGIPAIVGWPADQFVAVLKSYKSGDRKNPVMISVTEPLGEDEMKALAAHFGALPKPPQPAGKPAKSK
jgi:cytochrome c553